MPFLRHRGSLCLAVSFFLLCYSSKIRLSLACPLWLEHLSVSVALCVQIAQKQTEPAPEHGGAQSPKKASNATPVLVPVYTVPTFFGTGSEANGNAVVVHNVTGETIPCHDELFKPQATFVGTESFEGLSARFI